MGSSVQERYGRLVAQGGARLSDPRSAAADLARDEFVLVRLGMFRALGDPVRLLIAELLRAHGPLATTELEAATGVASSTVSYHLRVLESARVVSPEEVGGWRFWRLAAYPRVEAVVPP